MKSSNYLHNRDAIIENDRQNVNGNWMENGLSGKLKRRMMYIKCRMARLKKKKRRGSGTTRTGKKPVGIGCVQNHWFHTVKNALIIYFDKALSRLRAI